MSAKETITTLLEETERDINLCVYAYRTICNAPEAEHAELLRLFLTQYREGFSEDCVKELPEVISEDEARELAGLYQKDGDAQLLTLRSLNLSEEDFYQQLWDYIADSPDLPDDNARSFALYNMAIDARLPYYRLGWDKLISMDNDRFRELDGQLKTDGYCDKLIHILMYPLGQRTERNGLLINLLNSLPSDELRAVMFERILVFAKFSASALRDLGD